MKKRRPIWPVTRSRGVPGRHPLNPSGRPPSSMLLLLPDALHDAIVAAAKARGKARVEWVREACEAQIERERKAQK